MAIRTDWLIALIDKNVTENLANGWLTKCLTDLFINWLTDWVIDLVTRWLTDWLTDLVTYYVTGWLTRWLNWFTDQLPNKEHLIYWRTDELTD